MMIEAMGALPSSDRRRLFARWTGIGLIAVMLGVVLAGRADAQPVNLRPDWEPGQSAVYEVWSQVTQDVQASLGPENMQQSIVRELDGHVRWTVDQVNDDGSAQVTMTIEWLREVITAADEEVINDTRQGSGDEQLRYEMLSALTGHDLTVHVASDGSIEGVDGVDQIEAAAPAPEAAPDEQSMRQTAAELATIVSAPAEAEVGDTWSVEDTRDHELGQLHLNTTYELVEVGAIAGVPVATIFGQASVDVEIEEPEVPEGAPPVNTEVLDSSYSNQILFDLDRGEAVGRNELRQLSVESTMNLPDQEMRQRIDETMQSQSLRIEEE